MHKLILKKSHRQARRLGFSAIMLMFLVLTQLATTWHASTHPFHKTSMYCDTLLFAQAQPAQISTDFPLYLIFSGEDYWPVATFITIVHFFTWTVFTPRAPPL